MQPVPTPEKYAPRDPGHGTLPIRLFGAEAAAAGVRIIEIPMPGPHADCASLRPILLAVCPAIAGLLPGCRFAVNHEFVEDRHPVKPGDEVALIGRVSGG